MVGGSVFQHGREGCGWPGGGTITWADVLGGLVAQFCHHKAPEEQGQNLWLTPLPPTSL